MLFHFLNISQCVVCIFDHKKIYKFTNPLQREIFSLKKIPFQELQRTARLDYIVAFWCLLSQSSLLEYY